MLSSTPIIEYFNQIHCLDASPTSKFQDWSAFLQEPELLSQYLQPKTAPVCYPHDMDTTLIRNFHVSPEPLRKRSLEDANICAEPHTLKASSHTFCDSEVPRSKKSRTDQPSTKPLPERHARKQNFACDLCRKLKIKCVFNPGKEKCERCERGDVECLDGSLMRAAAAAARAQQGSKKRKKRPLESEGASSDPEPMHFTTKRIQTRTTADIFQDVVEEPKSEIQIGSTVQVKKSTQHHYKAKESVVTRVVCKVVAVYLDGSETDPIPINLVRLSEKQRSQFPTTDPISEHNSDLSPSVNDSQWNATKLSISHSQETKVDGHTLSLPAIPNQPSQSPALLVQDSLSGGIISKLDYPLPSPPLSMSSSEHASQALNVQNGITLNASSGQLMNQKRLIDLNPNIGPPPLTINTALASDYFLHQSTDSTMATPSTAFNPHLAFPNSQTTSPSQDGTYGFETMFSHELPNCSYDPRNQSKTSVTGNEHGFLSDGLSRASFDTASSPTGTSHSYRSSTPGVYKPQSLSNSTMSDPSPENSVALFAKLQELLTNALNQNTQTNMSIDLSSSIESPESIDTAKTAIRQFLNENEVLTQSSIPFARNLGNQNGYDNELNDSHRWF